MDLSKELKYLNMIHVNQEKIASKILPEVQLLVLEELRPTNKDLSLWRCTVGGKEEFKKYLESFFQYPLSLQFINFAWDYYNFKDKNCRSKSKKNLFLKSQYGKLKCSHCGIIDTCFEVDHKIPLSKSGKDEVSNMQILCRKCNRIKSDRFDYKMNLLMM